ncbi:sensor histidine kinase [Cohnella suwonensis]|uniref:histidine kinase n=1 Tax=Cohnella suwonensis TaxID=696072 RepID=A0ABW0M276_9BACL
MFLIVWPLALYLLQRSRRDKNANIWWIGLFLIAGGGGSYFYLMKVGILPYLQENAMLTPWVGNFLEATVIGFMLLYYYVLPYLFLMSAIALFPLQSLSRYVIVLIASVPSVWFVVSHLSPYSGNLYIQAVQPWAVLYMGAASLFYLAAWIRETDPVLKSNMLRLNVVFTPIIVWSLLKDFIYTEQITLTANNLVMINPDWHLQGNPIELWLFLLLLFYSIRSGFLGIKVRIERQRLDDSMRTISYGTELINHAIKNDVQKLDYFLEKLETLAMEGKTEEIRIITRRMSLITGQLQQMSDDIKGKSEEIVVHDKTVDLSALLQQILDGLEPMLRDRSIRLEYHYADDTWIRCDPRHVAEVFTNLCINAVESIERDNGLIRVNVRQSKNGLDVEVKDNGKGIDPYQAGKIFEPFFTTKKHSERNYGLGLSYASCVMQKHGGELRLVESRSHGGSLFRMRFPKKRLVRRRIGVTSERAAIDLHAKN